MTPNLMSFLARELRQRGIDASPPESPDRFEWTIARDKFGFTITTETGAYGFLRGLLKSAFGEPNFDSTHTHIFRNDKAQTTVMIHRETGSTQLTMLYWKDAVIRAEMETIVESALNLVVEDAVRKVEDLLVDAANASDDAKQFSTLEQALRKAEELSDAIDILECDNRN